MRKVQVLSFVIVQWNAIPSLQWVKHYKICLLNIKEIKKVFNSFEALCEIVLLLNGTHDS